VVNVTPRPLYPRLKEPVPILQGAEWVPGPVWAGAENPHRDSIRTLLNCMFRKITDVVVSTLYDSTHATEAVPFKTSGSIYLSSDSQ
jgi:hypothetical protein